MLGAMNILLCLPWLSRTFARGSCGLCCLVDISETFQFDTEWFNEVLGLNNVGSREVNGLSAPSGVSNLRTLLIGIFPLIAILFLIAITEILSPFL